VVQRVASQPQAPWALPSKSRVWEGVAGGRYRLINTLPLWQEFFPQLNSKMTVASDTESTSLSHTDGHIIGFSFSWGAADSYYVPVRHETTEKQLDIEKIRPDLREFFFNQKRVTTWHNFKHDGHFLMEEDLVPQGVVHDTRLMHSLIDENSLTALKKLACQEIHPDADKWERAVDEWRGAYARSVKKHKRDINYGLIPLDIMTPYASSDAHYEFALYKKKLPQIVADRYLMELYLVEIKLMWVLLAIEHNGVFIDKEYLEAAGPRLEKESDELKQKIIQKLGKVNVNSVKSLVPALEAIGIKFSKKTKIGAAFALDHEVLEALASKYQVCEDLLEYRSLTKIRSTYVDSILEKLDDDQGLHCTYNQNVTTGRMASRAPNLQNIPAKDKTIRKAFVVPKEIVCKSCGYVGKGFIVSDKCPQCASSQVVNSNDYVMVFIDFNQMEVRCTAHYSNDPILLSVYNVTHEDVHTRTMCEIFGYNYNEAIAILEDENHPKYNKVYFDRKIAKITNFLIIYGGSAKTLSVRISTPKKQYTEKECQRYIDQYFAKLKGVKRWINDTKMSLRKMGEVQNFFGRYRRFPELASMLKWSSNKWKVERCERQAVNFLIQSCKDIHTFVSTDAGMITLHDLFELNDKPAIHTYTGSSDNYKVHDTGVKEVLQLDTAYGTEMITKDHRFFAYKNGDLVIKQLSELVVGDYIVAMSKVAVGGAVTPKYANVAMAELIGVLCGNGNYSGKRNFTIAIGHNLEYGEHIQALIKRAFNDDNVHCPIRVRKPKAAHHYDDCHVAVDRVGLRKILEILGLGYVTRSNKVVPSWILTAPVSYRVACLRGLYDTDGGLVSGRYPQFTNISKNLAESFLLLANSLGFGGRIVEYPAKGKASRHWRVIIPGEKAVEFTELIDTKIECRRARINGPGRLPVNLVKDVANLILSSQAWNSSVPSIRNVITNGVARTCTYSMKKLFQRKEQSHIYRMRFVGHGSQRSCREYLNRIHEYSIDPCESSKILNLLDLVDLDWAEIRQIKELGKRQTMDIELEGPDHSYIGQGLLQHNSCADLFKIVMVRIGDVLSQSRSVQVMPIHDELIFYIHKDEFDLLPKIKSEMERFDFRVPMTVDISVSQTNWADKVPLKSAT